MLFFKNVKLNTYFTDCCKDSFNYSKFRYFGKRYLLTFFSIFNLITILLIFMLKISFDENPTCNTKLIFYFTFAFELYSNLLIIVGIYLNDEYFLRIGLLTIFINFAIVIRKTIFYIEELPFLLFLTIYIFCYILYLRELNIEYKKFIWEFLFLIIILPLLFLLH